MKWIKVFSLLLLMMLIASPAIQANENNFGEEDRSVIDGLNPDQKEVEEEPTNGSEEDVIDPPEDEGPPDISEDSEDEAPLAGYEDQNLFLMLLQLLLALGFVLFLIYMLLKFMNNRSRSFQGNRTIQTVGGTGVGQNRSVQIVRVGDRILVVGVGETVQLLQEITDPEEVERLSKPTEGGEFYEQPLSKFSAFLKRDQSDHGPSRQEDAFRSLLNREMDDVKQSQNKIHSAMKEKK
ncbi:flagellar biosynthetic protein FliO [Salisediminibacterium beveridgei]|uniref:flagellar biosynthetic protein FliO n=1 Tax=Salisediminibacterium beveridgei TaxID=632773 RepID=UPI0018DB36AA|nr:flagellar biosynthetic protein FliO [Salisediminibacterium beveridgei]